ncbi:MAG: enoyl-CoA hydratase [Thiothrix sp.]|nr:enoyl-CoA hydratase [Thiothrix sp.]HPE61853.1 enoyl-CoA hydratase [Thiolinea sp.]
MNDKPAYPATHSDPDQPLRSVLQPNGVLYLTLSRARQRNCLSEAVLDALQTALETAEADPACRVIVLGAEGPAFCAGHDLKELTAARTRGDGGRAYFADIMSRCARMMQTIVHHRVPVIAAVQGIATAAGCQLVASCDLAVASTAARFATPGVHIGLFCSTPMVALSRNISRKHAMEMLLTGDWVAAERAAAIGLINQAVAPEALDGSVQALADTIASKSSMTLKTGKQAFYRQLEMGLAEAYAYTADVMVENMLKADAEEGINAFVEKRQPHWRDA